jgi:hypothetical protein
MKLLLQDMDSIYDYCCDVTGIHNLYEEIVVRYPQLSPIERREAFLAYLAGFLRQGVLKFHGEAQIFRFVDRHDGGGVTTQGLAEYHIFQKIIDEGRYWQSTPDQQRVLREHLIFDDCVFSPDETGPGGLRLPKPTTPEAVVNAIRSKWPPEIVPRVNRRDFGFDPIWFEKWCFEWIDRGERAEDMLDTN